MRCDDFERRFNQLLDERGFPDDDLSLQAHAMECADCSELVVGERRMRELLRQPIPTLPADFTSTIVASVSNKNRVVRRNWWPYVVSLATAAALLVAVIPAARRLRITGVARNEASTVEESSTSHAPVGTLAMWGAGTRRASTDAQSTAPAANPEEMRQLIRTILQKIPEVQDAQLEPIDRIAGGFRPLASTLGAAIDVLRRSLPVGRENLANEPQAVFPVAHGRTDLVG